jgi:mono/diheme cytochrome c family protein
MRFITAGRVKVAVLLTALFAALWIVAVSGLSAQPVAAQRNGGAVYSQNCARCHGADGRAQTQKGRQTKAVDFTSDDWTPDADHDARKVANGKGSMPPFKNKLTPAEINAVVQYIRRFKH